MKLWLCGIATSFLHVTLVGHLHSTDVTVYEPVVTHCLCVIVMNLTTALSYTQLIAHLHRVTASVNRACLTQCLCDIMMYVTTLFSHTQLVTYSPVFRFCILSPAFYLLCFLKENSAQSGRMQLAQCHFQCQLRLLMNYCVCDSVVSTTSSFLHTQLISHMVGVNQDVGTHRLRECVCVFLLCSNVFNKAHV